MLPGCAACVANSGPMSAEEGREREGLGQLPTLLQRTGTDREKWVAFFRQQSSASTTASIISEGTWESGQEFDLKTPISCAGEFYTDESLQTAASPLWMATVQFCSSHIYNGTADCFSGLLNVLKKISSPHPEEARRGEHTSPSAYSCKDHTALTAYSSKPSASNLVMWEDDEGNWQFADLSSPRRQRRKH